MVELRARVSTWPIDHSEDLIDLTIFFKLTWFYLIFIFIVQITLAMASVFPYTLCCLIVFLPFFAVSQENITIGATLSATTNSTSLWLSSSGDFAFGFHQLGDNEDLFLLAIWYAKIPDKTIVWYPKNDSQQPVLSGSRSTVTLASNGLMLSDSNGDEVWKSNITQGSVLYAVMNNTGNLMLKSSHSVLLWESFKSPTDTILPTLIMEQGMVVSSKLSEASFSRGRFQLSLQRDSRFVLTSINIPSNNINDPYFITDTNNATDPTNSGHQLVFNNSGSIFILSFNNQMTLLTDGVVGSESDFYYRATLNFDGVFIKYSHQKNSSSGGSWKAIWSIPDNICQSTPLNIGSGVCGFNTLCRIDIDRRPICECPIGYSLLDPNDAYRSCKLDNELSCAEEKSLNISPEDLYRMEEIKNVNWPLNNYMQMKPFTEDQCIQWCLHDCFCAVAISGVTACWKKKMPLSNGRYMTSGNGTTKALIKIRKDNATTRSDPSSPTSPGLKGKEDKDGFIAAGSILLSGSGFINLVLLSVVCYICYLFYHKKLQKVHQSSRGGTTETNLRYFTFKELVQATNGFKEELGRGSFGIVYKGKLQIRNNDNNIAVKKLDRQVQDGDKEFKAEVNVIGQTQHRNLVRLIGFCDEGQNRLLVYEFLPNGTLANFLFESSPKPSWNQRMDIVFSIARGLLYLHEECRTQIIHCDIKPQNILLDDNFNARISDFGLAKLLMLDQSHTNTGIRGTKGYVAPEWFRNMPITAKVDVYSFGVILLEVISCRKSVDMNAISADRAILTDWAYDCYQEKRLDLLVGDDFEALVDKANFERYAMIALWCIQEDPSLRPNMRKVTQMLEGVVDVSVPPCPCPFSIETPV